MCGWSVFFLLLLLRPSNVNLETITPGAQVSVTCAIRGVRRVFRLGMSLRQANLFFFGNERRFSFTGSRRLPATLTRSSTRLLRLLSALPFRFPVLPNETKTIGSEPQDGRPSTFARLAWRPARLSDDTAPRHARPISPPAPDRRICNITPGTGEYRRTQYFRHLLAAMQINNNKKENITFWPPHKTAAARKCVRTPSHRINATVSLANDKRFK